MTFLLAVVLAQLDAGAQEPPPTPPPADAPMTETASGVTPTVQVPGNGDGVADAEHLASQHEFVKGELSTYLGSDRLSVKRNRVGVSAGVDFFKDTYYLLVEPQVDLRFFDARLGIGLGVPLRIEIFNFNDQGDQVIGFSHAGRIRKEDWDSVHDFGRLLKYINFGKKEDNLYVNIGQRYATSLGHGEIMRRYAPNIDVDYPRVSAEVDAYNDYAGFEAFTNDILEWNVLAALAFVKPLSFFHPDNLLAKTLSIGVTAAVDRNAPNSLIYDPFNGSRQLTSDGRLAANTSPVGLVGVDAEMKIVKTGSVDIKPYVDYSHLIGGDGGLTVGALGRFNLGKDIVNAFRIVLEGRYLGNHYQPSYFDTFYEIDRYQSRVSGRNAWGIDVYSPKQNDVLVTGLKNRGGVYAEASWGIANKIGFTVAIEAAMYNPTNFIAHLEIPWLDFLQIFGSYYRRGIDSTTNFGKLDQNTILFAGARLKVLPFLFINGRVYKTFRIDDATQRYDNQLGFSVDLEIGYEFGRSKEEAEEQKLKPTTPVSEPTPASPEAVPLNEQGPVPSPAPVEPEPVAPPPPGPEPVPAAPPPTP